jgi:hypothetical protein
MVMRIHSLNGSLVFLAAWVLGAGACGGDLEVPEAAGQPVSGAPTPAPAPTPARGAGDPQEVIADGGIIFPSAEGGPDATAPPGPAPLPQPPRLDAGGGGHGFARIAIDGICCYGSNYFACPNTAACYGGFDINACLATCSGPEDPCFDACFSKEDSAGPPLGCPADMAEPPGVDCATGTIQLGL